MKRLLLIISAVLIVFLPATYFVYTKLTNNDCTIVNYDSTYINEFLIEINKARKENKLNEVSLSRKLTTGTKHKAYEYLKNREWNHNINGKTWTKIYDECNISEKFQGENLARGYGKNIKDIIRDWLISPTHKKVLLDPEYRQVGLFIGDQSMDFYTVALFTN